MSEYAWWEVACIFVALLMAGFIGMLVERHADRVADRLDRIAEKIQR